MLEIKFLSCFTFVLSLLGFQVIPQAFYDLGYVNNGLMILPPMALIVIAVIIWVHRAKNKELQEN